MIDEKTNITGNETLRPRARIMRTLGDQLISSEGVAITELVKNAGFEAIPLKP